MILCAIYFNIDIFRISFINSRDFHAFLNFILVLIFTVFKLKSTNIQAHMRNELNEITFLYNWVNSL